MKQWIVAGLSIALLMAGCKTTEKAAQRISWKQQQAYLKKVQDPRIYGLYIYDTPGGPEIRGGGRLHPGRAEALEMMAEEPLRPLVEVKGNMGEHFPVLLDFTSRATWMEFGLATELRARPVGEMQKPVLTMTEDDIPAALSIVSSLKLGQMFIEYPLVNVRLASGSLGSLNRDVSEGPVRAVIGWDLLKKFDQVQLLYSLGQVVLATTEAYEPNPEQLAATLPMIKDAGVCAVRGRVNGQEGNILIDPAGDFEVAADMPVSSLQLGEGFLLTDPAAKPSLDGTVRIGARILQDYRVTVCPKAAVIHFETLAGAAAE